jgi:prevent-host-death family protein
MIFQTSVVVFRQNLGEMLNQVQYRQDHIVISKDGKPVAALVDVKLFERIRRQRSRFEALSERLASGFSALPPSDGIAEMEVALRDQRAAS